MLRLLSVLFVAVSLSAAERPNVLFIIADDYCTALTSYGRSQVHTPNLDRLASQGVSFDNAFCQFSLCGPSRASFMCGLYPVATGVVNNGGTFRKKLPNHPTMGQWFKDNGYWSGRVSKIYHMGIPGDILLGTDGTDDGATWTERYNVQGPEHLTPGKFEDASPKYGGDATPLIAPARADWFAGKRTKVVTPNQGGDFLIVEADATAPKLPDVQSADKAIELLGQRAADKSPFFLAVGMIRPHLPFVAPESFFQPYDSDALILPDVADGELAGLPKAAKEQTNAVKYHMTDAQARHALRGYYASVTFMDQQVGRVLDRLDELGLRDNTIVVFTSDHGWHLGEHSMWQKLSTFDQGSRVPLIISAPGRKARNVRTSQLVALLDVYPTLADLAGLTIPPALQGVSFKSLLDNPAGPAVRSKVLLMTNNNRAIRTDRFKYMQYGKEAVLFDLQNDPAENNNLIRNPEYAQTVAELKADLEASFKLAADGGKP